MLRGWILHISLGSYETILIESIENLAIIWETIGYLGSLIDLYENQYFKILRWTIVFHIFQKKDELFLFISFYNNVSEDTEEFLNQKLKLKLYLHEKKCTTIIVSLMEYMHILIIGGIFRENRYMHIYNWIITLACFLFGNASVHHLQ